MKLLLTLVLTVLTMAVTTYVLKERSISSVLKEVTPTSFSAQKKLDLSNQGLTKVPMSVFSQTDLEELNLSHNTLDGALQSQVGQLKNLKVLNLSNNNFTGVPAEVGQLKNLEVLNLSHNKLTGLPSELGNLSKLKLLDISGNDYSEADLAGIRNKLPAPTVIKTN